MQDDELIEVMARAANGPHLPVPITSPFSLDELRDCRWKMLSGAERQAKINEARAALAAYRATRAAVSEDDDAHYLRTFFGCDDLGNGDFSRLDQIAARIEALSRENAELHERLEDNRVYDADGKRVDVQPGSIPDGIDTRDETIKLLDAKVISARRQALEEAAKVADGFSRFEIGGPHADAPQLIGRAIRNLIGEKSS